MILGIDASRGVGPRTGVGRCIQHLLASWATEPGLPFAEVRVFAPAAIADLATDPPFRQVVLPGSDGGLGWQMRKLRPAAEAVDVLYAPYTLPPRFRGVGVVNNLGIYEGEHAFASWRARARSRHMAYSARRAAVVVANSESTKRDVVRHYRVPVERVVVVWPGVADVFRPAQPGEEADLAAAASRFIGSAEPYVLLVGKLSARRNVGPLLEAFRAVHHRTPSLRLLLVGPNTDRFPIGGRVVELGLEGAVRHIEFVDQETLALLLRGAQAFVLPTEHEGFSFTILEALASGCPVVTVDHASLHEAGVDSATLVVPRPDPGLLADALRRAVEDEGLRAELRQRGLRIAARLSWSETARRTMAVLERTALAAQHGAEEP